jgi:hypothetical protein
MIGRIVTPGLLDAVNKKVDGISGGAAGATAKLMAREQLVFIAEVSEVFSNQG